MLFILAVAVGVIIGALCKNYAEGEEKLVVVAAAVAGFILGFAGTYLIARHLML